MQIVEIALRIVEAYADTDAAGMSPAELKLFLRAVAIVEEYIAAPAAP